MTTARAERRPPAVGSHISPPDSEGNSAGRRESRPRLGDLPQRACDTSAANFDAVARDRLAGTEDAPRLPLLRGRSGGPAADAPAAAPAHGSPDPTLPRRGTPDRAGRPGGRPHPPALPRPAHRGTRPRGAWRQGPAGQCPAGAQQSWGHPRQLARAGYGIDGSPQPDRIGVRIHLRRGNRNVPEEVLGLVDRAARVQDIRGERVPHLMRPQGR